VAPLAVGVVVSVGVARPQLYRKRHLVPFGETIPLEPVVGWFIRKVLAIPIENAGAEEIAFAESALDPLPINGWQSYRVT
jgi:apolipoprotein N-acyltransferase